MYSPLDQIVGRVKEVSLAYPISLANLLHSLTDETPALAPYLAFGPLDVQPYGLLIWRDGRLLTLADTLNPTDELEMIPMVAGG